MRNMNTQQDYRREVGNSLREGYFIKGDKPRSILEVMEEDCIPGASVAEPNNECSNVYQGC